MANVEEILQTEKPSTPFGEYEEQAIIALMLDNPQFFINLITHFDQSIFSTPQVKYVITHILNYNEKYHILPTREMLIDRVKKHLTADDPNLDDILELISRDSNPRDVPAIKAAITEWVKHRIINTIYSTDAVNAVANKDYDKIYDILEKARQVQEVGNNGLWLFEDYERLFIFNESEQFTSGLGKLDQHLECLSRREVLCYMAPTGVGKSLMLVNAAVGNSRKGKRVLYITLELSDVKSAIRAVGSLTGKRVNKEKVIQDNKSDIISSLTAYKAAGVEDIAFYEFPPSELSVDGISALIDHIKNTRSGWKPDVVIIDYMELMVPRNKQDNEYLTQKTVSTEIRGLAKKENVFVITATQTNRSGNDSEKYIDVTKISESYGKSMSLDYLVSINQSPEEYAAAFEEHAPIKGEAFIHLYVAKARSSEKFKKIEAKINYYTMAVRDDIGG